MIPKNASFVSVLCRKFNYSYEDFWKLLEATPRQIKHHVIDREQLSKADALEAIAHLREIYGQLAPYTILHPAHPHYPERWQSALRPPVFLCAQGNLRFLEQTLLTVIGSRRTLPAFTDWMDSNYVEFLRKNNVVTVSGGAYGIDTYATKMALFSGRPSILILPSGFSRPYPLHVGRWLKHENVLSLTEYFPNEIVRNYYFVNRNRLLGALSPHLFVVQCAAKSGTMTTVKYALDAGVDVMTLPSFPGAIESSGNIALLKEGAQIITAARDLELGVGVLAPHPKSEQKEDQIRNP